MRPDRDIQEADHVHLYIVGRSCLVWLLIFVISWATVIGTAIVIIWGIS